ncbi:zinc metallopeptidase [Geosporobacter ferrireducens]|uniref:Peptidase n=1 Tax=Geosporobacter ferrireducens TaxID=1424294 RepID=A0A1D8GE53_9FIRM|nr:zinc metallopeptidase [Geosporobacter ferrireducens]AOT69186.1 peptidase [Geosporobacter ferrireducens]MTI56863.1 zinc metallopeptidase [Geosporobacter ferrireducens]
MFPFFYDPSFILIIPAILLAMYAQNKVQSTFNKYVQHGAKLGMTGAQLASDILRKQGMHDVKTELVGGHMTDHYDPRSKVLRLSYKIYHGTSLAALGIAAHEVGHAIQHDEGYALLSLRNMIVPLASIGSQAAFPLLFIGLLMGSQSLAGLGVVVFMFAVLFQLITLPVEYNASSRALDLLTAGNYISFEEEKPVKKVLDAAALTYVAATVMAVLQLLRLLMISGLLGRRND